MELDEWLPKACRLNSGRPSGSITLENIEKAFRTWLGKDDVTQQLRVCAAELVQCRIDRTRNKDRWEQFATGA